MKKFSKILSLALAVILSVGIFAGCGEKNLYKDFSQDGGFKYVDSDIVLYPGGQESVDKTKQSLNLGVGDKTLNNVFFTYEKQSANGVSGSTEWTADFSAETTKFSNMNTLLANNSKGASLDIVVPDSTGGEELSAFNFFSVKGIQDMYTYDMESKEYYLVIESGECSDSVDIIFYTNAPIVTDTIQMTVNANENVVINLNDLCKNANEALISPSTRAFFDLRFKKGGPYQFKNMSIKVMPAGNQPAENSEVEWLPYSTTEKTAFPNGTTVTAQDYFFNENTVTRKVTLNQTGAFVIGGEIAEGATAAYDSKLGVISVDGANGVNYAIKLGTKEDIKFYATEEDMLASTWALDDTTEARFWTVTVKDMKADDFKFFSVAASTETPAADLISAAKSGGSKSKAKKRLKVISGEDQ